MYTLVKMPNQTPLIHFAEYLYCYRLLKIWGALLTKCPKIIKHFPGLAAIKGSINHSHIHIKAMDEGGPQKIISIRTLKTRCGDLDALGCEFSVPLKKLLIFIGYIQPIYPGIMIPNKLCSLPSADELLTLSLYSLRRVNTRGRTLASIPFKVICERGCDLCSSWWPGYKVKRLKKKIKEGNEPLSD